jgi:hypothetical protein
MTTNRRIELLAAFEGAGARGLTMTEGRFTAQDVSNLEGLIEREPGPTGVYKITLEGQKYLAVMDVEVERLAA